MIECYGTKMQQLHHPIVVVRENHAGFERLGFFLRHTTVGYDNHDIPYLGLAGGSSIETHHARAAFAPDGVGHEALAVVIIDNMYLFVFDDSHRIHQILVDGDAADVVEFGLRHLHTVDFRLHKGNLHDSIE